MFNGIYFEYPEAAIVLLIFGVCFIFCKMRLPSFYFPHTSQFAKDITSQSRFLYALKWLAVIFLTIALMSPVKEYPFMVKPRQGIDIALILDTSGSMNTMGFDPYHPNYTRFDVVKQIVKKFIKHRFNDNIGIVVFGTYSFIASPLTYDKNILLGIVSRLHVAMAGPYTALYDSLAQGVNLLKNSKAKTKIAILMTDGYNTQNVTRIPLHVALKMAKQYHIKIYTIGIGDNFDKALLQHIASATHAEMFSATNASKLRAIYQKLNQLKKSGIRSQNYVYKKYYFAYPLFAGLFFLFIYILVINKRGRE